LPILWTTPSLTARTGEPASAKMSTARRFGDEATASETFAPTRLPSCTRSSSRRSVMSSA
jgi:hypothetical protein